MGIQNELYKLCNLDGDSLLKRMAEGMKMKYEKYGRNIENINLLLFVAVVLDRRYKMKYIVYWFNKWYAKPKAESMVEKVKGAIDRLYAYYATKFETASSIASGSSSCVTPDVALSFMSCASDTHDPWKSLLRSSNTTWLKRIVVNAKLRWTSIFQKQVSHHVLWVLIFWVGGG